MSTARHNAACRIVLEAIRSESTGRWLILANFGRTDDEPEQKTVPSWMLPQTDHNAPRRNKPDFDIVAGWPQHSLLPTVPIPAGSDSPIYGDMSIRFVPVELKYTNDLHTLEKHVEARDIYSGPNKLTGALHAACLKVEHNFPTVVIGQRAVV